MSFIGSILGDLGVGSTTATGGNSGYSFSQQDKDFIKLQFKYAILLKNKLAAGQISQAYYDANFWLTTEQLTPPYNGWWDEFKTAIQAEDLNWLAKQVGEGVDQLVIYMGDALAATASVAGKIVSAGSTGIITGFFGSLNLTGWLVVGGIAFGVYYGWQKGYIQTALKTGKYIAL